MSNSNSSPTNTTQSDTQVQTKNLNTSGNTGNTATSESGDVAIYNVSTDAGAVQAATGLASHALDTVYATSDNANRDVLDIAKSSGAALFQLNDRFATALTDLATNDQKQIGNTVSALNQIAVANNTPAGSQLLDVVQGSFKYVLIVGALIAVVYLAGKSK